MRGTGPQVQLAAELREAGAEVQRAIAGLSEGEMSAPAIDGWSVKDHLIHMTVWHEMRFHEISRIARGGRAAFPALTDEQVESLNQLTVSLRRALALSQVLDDLEFARSLVIEAITASPEAALREGNFGEVGLRGGIQHDLEHARTIREWRQREGR